MLTIERHNMRAQRTERLPVNEAVVQRVLDAVFPNSTRSPWWLDDPDQLFHLWRQWTTAIVAHPTPVSTVTHPVALPPYPTQVITTTGAATDGETWDVRAARLRRDHGYSWAKLAALTGHSAGRVRLAVARVNGETATTAQSA